MQQAIQPLLIGGAMASCCTSSCLEPHHSGAVVWVAMVVVVVIAGSSGGLNCGLGGHVPLLLLVVPPDLVCRLPDMFVGTLGAAGAYVELQCAMSWAAPSWLAASVSTHVSAAHNAYMRLELI